MCEVTHAPIVILGPQGERSVLQSSINTTVRDLKATAAQTFGGDVHPTFNGKSLDDDNALLTKYGINPKSVIHLVMRVNGG